MAANNSIIMVGRIAKEPKSGETSTGHKWVYLRMAVKRRKKDADALQFTLTPVIDQNEILMHQLAAMGATDLPGVNRELRLILGQAPGMRSLIMAYFRIKRLQRGLGQFVETGASLNLSLTLIATAIILLKSAISYQQNIERQQRDYEMFIRRERGWTHQEFVKGRNESEEFYRSLPG